MSCSSTLRASAIALLVAGAAHAGPVEQLLQFAQHPTDPNVMMLRYQNGGDGFFRSDDGGETWRLLCNDAIDPAMRSGGRARFGITSDGTILMGVTSGLYVGEGGGCRWTKVVEFDGIWVSDIVIDPTDPQVAFAATSLNAAGITNGIWRRDPNGAWSEIGTREELLVFRLRAVATPNGVRFYEDVLRGTGMPMLLPVFRVSDDEGQSWDEFPVDSTYESRLRLEAVDPSAPDRIVASVIRDGEADSVLVSVDRGETFTEYMTVTEFGGIAFAPDGRVWIGDQGNSGSPGAPVGVWYAPSLDASPEQLSDVGVWCLAHGGGDILYGCERWSFGAIDTTSGALTKSFTMLDVEDFVTCDGVDMAAVCKAQLCADYCGPGHFAQAPLCCAYDDPYCGPAFLEPDEVRCEGFSPPNPDGGTVVPSVDAGGGPRLNPVASGGGCACTSAGQSARRAATANETRSRGAPFSAAFAAGLVALSLFRRRNRRHWPACQQVLVAPIRLRTPLSSARAGYENANW